MRDDIQRGVLKPGDRLPTHRDLAYRLKITTGTVTRAYSEADKMGLLVGEAGRGSFVRAPGASAAAFISSHDGIIELSNAVPPSVQLTQDLDDALRRVMLQPSRLDLLDYTPTAGHPLHRDMGAKWLARSGIEVSDEQVVVTSGAQAALISVLARGVRITAGNIFAMDRRADDQGIRVCLGGASSRQQLREGVDRLNTLLDEHQEEHFNAVA